VVGLYLDPPEGALVLCVDEKSQILALDRTAPSLPMLPTTPARRTHDYVRNGTTSLFAALDVASGKVISALHRRHRHQEFLKFLKFLKRIDTKVPAELDLQLICDNYQTHKTPEIKRWLLRHPRFHLHLTPTYSSWQLLAELGGARVRRADHPQAALLRPSQRGRAGSGPECLDPGLERRPKPFVRT
jgi:transposase